MSMWRCPHCGTPQAETARCWVCHRSSTTCSTCRHFRRSVAAQLGYCGLDRKRLPLIGSELRGCWEAGPTRPIDVTPGETAAVLARPDPVRLRDFIPVSLSRDPAPISATPAASGSMADLPDANHARADRLTLFADRDL
jgi:hypothetical protein